MIQSLRQSHQANEGGCKNNTVRPSLSSVFRTYIWLLLLASMEMMGKSVVFLPIWKLIADPLCS